METVVLDQLYYARESRDAHRNYERRISSPWRERIKVRVKTLFILSRSTLSRAFSLTLTLSRWERESACGFAARGSSVFICGFPFSDSTFRVLAE